MTNNESIDIPFTVINGVSVLVCLLAVIFVFCLKLYKKLVYRLSLYQVLASLAFATVETLQIIFINYGTSKLVRFIDLKAFVNLMKNFKKKYL